MIIVMKFGGTAVDSPDKVRHVAQLIKSHKAGNDVVCVVSAVRGMTDGLLSIADSVRRGDRTSIEDFVKKSLKTHTDIVNGAISDKKLREDALASMKKTIGELEDVLGGIVLLGEVTPKSLDYLMSFGERLSTPIVAYALADMGVDSEYLTGKEAGIVTDSNFGEARPLMDTTKLRVSHRLGPVTKRGAVPVITGFIGADQHGNTTTIGRGGSDYTATIVAASIGASEVWLWSDVDGLMTADPKIVKGAQVLKEVSFAEAMEMALFGAKYMHPRALEPVMDTKIPIRIRNTFNVKHPGTVITQNPSRDSQKIVKSVSAIRHTALIDVSGGGMVGAPGTAAKIFDTLAKNRVNIMMISQSPSESSISMVVRKSDLDKATTTLELNLLGKVIKQVNVSDDVAVIAVVGSGMRGIKGVAAKVFGAVAKRKINVIMIAQGSSELNLAFVVNDSDCEGAVNALHDEFGLGKTRVRK
ncbi:aspartate kinase [Candidatus Nitrososphaera evergladensis SR1]|uniref:Aspartokinase n=2 Tax=Nitrososphaera TaxID=497726 RepID=A0A075MUM1_9ARCH|nr:aspartate kinase [Candidatus Nitrososphaera evergladensis SR1]